MPLFEPGESAATDEPLHLRVLVVDQDNDSATGLAFVATWWGCQVQTCESAKEALRIAPTFQPDVVLVRSASLGSDAYAIAEWLRTDEATSATRVVAIGGTPPDAQGVVLDGYLDQPLDLRQLRRLLASANARRAALVGKAPPPHRRTSALSRLEVRARCDDAEH